MGSFPIDGVDATPDPRFGASSSTSQDNHAPTDQPVVQGSGQQEVPIARGARPWRPSGRAGLRPHGSPRGPSQEAVEADIRRIRQALIVTLGILVAIWGVYFINDQFELGLNRFGNRPLKWTGIPGILSMAFLHGSWDHLWGNTVSFFTLNAILLYFYRGIGPKVLFWTWVGSGVLLWTSGAPGNHIGLSGVIYGLAAFLFVSGVIRKHAILMRVALVVVFLYGSIVWGVLPIEVGVSWEGHLAGACAGILLALVMRGEGPQPAPVPDGLEEEEDADPEGFIDLSDTLEGDDTEHSAPDLAERRRQLMWKGQRPMAQKPHPPSSRGIRKMGDPGQDEPE